MYPSPLVERGFLAFDGGWVLGLAVPVRRIPTGGAGARARRRRERWRCLASLVVGVVLVALDDAARE
jgi:cytochrome c biogenesis protein CcdA